ncbi:MAG: hypothetical protein MUF62_08030 [Chitinophagaceae bacterium]|nr:hypothetical protein [Chitinophagaceae bacterium]
MLSLLKRYPLLYVALMWLLAASCLYDVVTRWHTAASFPLFLRASTSLVLWGLGCLELYSWWRQRPTKKSS